MYSENVKKMQKGKLNVCCYIVGLMRISLFNRLLCTISLLMNNSIIFKRIVANYIAITWRLVGDRLMKILRKLVRIIVLREINC